MHIQENLKRGTAEIVLLHLLQQRSMYGYEIMQEMKARSNGKFILKDGSMYPILYRMIDKGLIKAERVLVGKRRTRVYYHLTDAGKNILEILCRNIYLLLKVLQVYLIIGRKQNAGFRQRADIIDI
jgi:PadR family transcriptional regulator PadR